MNPENEKLGTFRIIRLADKSYYEGRFNVTYVNPQMLKGEALRKSKYCYHNGSAILSTEEIFVIPLEKVVTMYQ